MSTLYHPNMGRVWWWSPSELIHHTFLCIFLDMSKVVLSTICGSLLRFIFGWTLLDTGSTSFNVWIIRGKTGLHCLTYILSITWPSLAQLSALSTLAVSIRVANSAALSDWCHLTHRCVDENHLQESSNSIHTGIKSSIADMRWVLVLLSVVTEMY